MELSAKLMGVVLLCCYGRLVVLALPIILLMNLGITEGRGERT